MFLLSSCSRCMSAAPHPAGSAAAAAAAPAGVQAPGACYSVVAAAWVWMYENLWSPKAYQTVAHGQNLDELLASVGRLHSKRQDLRDRLVSSVTDAKRCKQRDPRTFRQRCAGVRRLKGQLDKMDASIAAIECNVDQVLHSDITRDIVDSFRQSIAAIRSSGTQLGTPDTINDFMDELQTELQNATDITDALYGKASSTGELLGGAGDLDLHDDDLVRELDQILLDEDALEDVDLGGNRQRSGSALVSEYPSVRPLAPPSPWWGERAREPAGARNILAPAGAQRETGMVGDGTSSVARKRLVSVAGGDGSGAGGGGGGANGANGAGRNSMYSSRTGGARDSGALRGAKENSMQQRGREDDVEFRTEAMMLN